MKLFLIAIVSFFVLDSYAQKDYSKQYSIANEVATMAQAVGYEKAIDKLIASKASFDPNNDFEMLLYSWALGGLYYDNKDFSSALPHIQNTVDICNRYNTEAQTKDNELFLRAYWWLAYSKIMLGYSIDAYKLDVIQAKDLFDRLSLTDSPVYSSIIYYNNLLETNFINDYLTGVQAAIKNNWDIACPKLERCYQAASNSNDFQQFHVALYLSAVYVGQDNLEQAENLLYNSIKKLEGLGQKDAEIYRHLLDNLGGVFFSLRNYKSASKCHEDAKMLYEKNHDFGENYVRCLVNMTSSQREMGYNVLAKLLMESAVKQARINFDTRMKSGDFPLPPNENNSTKSNDESIKRLYIQNHIMFLTGAAAVFSDFNYDFEAMKLLREAKSYSETYDIKYANLYQVIGDIYISHSKFSEAKTYMEKAMECPMASLDRVKMEYDFLWSLYLNDDPQTYETAYSQSKSLCEIINTYFTFLSESQRENLWNNFASYIPVINQMLVESSQSQFYGQVYDNILYSKGLLLRTTSNIKEAIDKSGDTQLKASLTHLIQLQQELLVATDKQQQDSLRERIEILDKNMSKKVLSYATSKSSTIQWKDIKNTLKADEIAIEFCRLPIFYKSSTWNDMRKEYGYYALTLRKGYKEPHVIYLCSESELSDVDPMDFYETDSIYKRIWKPILIEMKGVKNVYFSADRELHRIAIEYVVNEHEDRMSELFGMYRLSSTREIVEKTEGSTKNNAALFGGLKYDLKLDDLVAESRSSESHRDVASRSLEYENLRYGVKYLPGTLEEVIAIDRTLSKEKGNICRLITDIHGTEESFRALSSWSPNIIHLATHGFFWTEEEAKNRSYVTFLSKEKNQSMFKTGESMYRSGLFFSGANIGLMGNKLPDDVEDGVLTAKEISTLNLGNVDMVVMSACQSGLGDTYGEGVFGLQRGFKLAGAKSLLMSLWKVDDKATQLLMTEFYNQLLSGKSKTESLRTAQNFVRSYPEYQDPEYWAGFILLDALN